SPALTRHHPAAVGGGAAAFSRETREAVRYRRGRGSSQLRSAVPRGGARECPTVSNGRLRRRRLGAPRPARRRVRTTGQGGGRDVRRRHHTHQRRLLPRTARQVAVAVRTRLATFGVARVTSRTTSAASAESLDQRRPADATFATARPDSPRARRSRNRVVPRSPDLLVHRR